MGDIKIDSANPYKKFYDNTSKTVANADARANKDNETKSSGEISSEDIEQAQEFAQITQEVEAEQAANPYQGHVDNAKTTVQNADKKAGEPEVTEAPEVVEESTEEKVNPYQGHVDNSKKVADEADKEAGEPESAQETEPSEESTEEKVNPYQGHVDNSKKVADEADKKAGEENKAEGENSNEEAVDFSNQEVNKSFEGELTDSAEVNYYTNKMKKDDPDYKALYERLMNDKNVSVYDKYKLLDQMKEAGYEFDEADTYSNLMSDMSKCPSEYNFEDIKKIDEKCIEAFKKEGNPIEKWNQWLTPYDESKHAYLQAWADLYANSKGNSELQKQYSEIMPLDDLALYAQQYLMLGNEDKILKTIFSSTSNGDLNLNENEELAKKYAGLEEDYKSVKDVMKAYESGDISAQEAMYIFSCKYENAEELMEAFRKMSGKNEEKYLQDILGILQS